MMLDEARGFAEACGEYANGVGDSFYRGAFRKAAEVINNLCDEITTGKEREEGEKEKSPTPPIKKKGKERKKATTTATRAHTREESACSYVGPLWDDVLKYANHPKVKIDPEYALWWYGQMDALGWCDPDCINEPLGNWKQLLRVWWSHRGKSGDDWKKPAEPKPHKYSADEWCLCAERCQHFDAKLCKCRSGCCVPPEHREHPITPEECERYARKEEAI